MLQSPQANSKNALLYIFILYYMYIEIPGYIFFWCDPKSAVKIIIIKNLSKTDAVDGIHERTK